MKLFKKIAAAILALIAAIMILFGFSSISSGNVFNIVFSFIVAAACLFCTFKLFGFTLSKEKQGKQEPIKPYAQPQVQQPRMIIETRVGYKPDKPEQPSGYPHKRKHYIAYHYEDVQIASRDRYADVVLTAGDRLKFVPEPDNQFDDAAVAIYKGAEKVGYMYRGRLQDMVHDFIERGDAVAGVAVSDDNGKAVYKIAFYKKEDSE